MSKLSRLLSLIAIFASAVAMFFRKRADEAEKEAEHNKERADRAEAVVVKQQNLNHELMALNTKHAKENKDDKSEIDAGGRSHFERPWW